MCADMTKCATMQGMWRRKTPRDDAGGRPPGHGREAGQAGPSPPTCWRSVCAGVWEFVDSRRFNMSTPLLTEIAAPRLGALRYRRADAKPRNRST